MKLLVCDFDGTLYPKDKKNNEEQFEKNIKAIKRWVDAGNKFAIATARRAYFYDELKKVINFDFNYIGSNGAELFYESGESNIKQMPCRIFIDLCQYIKDNNINASVATVINNQYVWSSKNCYPIKGVKEDDISWNNITILDLEKIDPEYKIERIQIFVPNEKLEFLKNRIKKRNYPVTITQSDTDLIDIGPINSSKGISIVDICDKYQICSLDLLVIGDSENDISMFEVANRSYCISHAEKKVKDAATYVVSSVEEVIELEL